MQSKLTLRVNEELIRIAKQYANQHGVTLSFLVENYLKSLAIDQNAPLMQTPILDRLTGILPEETSIDEYLQHIDVKYG